MTVQSITSPTAAPQIQNVASSSSSSRSVASAAATTAPQPATYSATWPFPDPPNLVRYVPSGEDHPTLPRLEDNSPSAPEVDANAPDSGPLVDLNSARRTRSLRELQPSAKKCLVGLKFEVMAEVPALDPFLSGS